MSNYTHFLCTRTTYHDFSITFEISTILLIDSTANAEFFLPLRWCLVAKRSLAHANVMLLVAKTVRPMGSSD